MQNCTRIRISRPVASVFESFVCASQLEHFWYAASVPRLRLGKVVMRYDAYNVSFTIDVIEITKNERIVFSWGSEKDGTRMVYLKFLQAHEGGCVIEIIEDGFDPKSPDYITELVTNKEGWGYMLSCWKHYLEDVHR